MYFKNDFGKVYVENGNLYVETKACTITIEPKVGVHDCFIEEEFELQVGKLQMAQMVLPPQK